MHNFYCRPRNMDFHFYLLNFRTERISNIKWKILKRFQHNHKNPKVKKWSGPSSFIILYHVYLNVCIDPSKKHFLNYSNNMSGVFLQTNPKNI
jgi:hypothetical protein